ncbi:SIMPL domain-containing protein [Flavobacterium sp. UBA7663]|uniref:SIMPL domain-containing protein n=1 Tax=Flavobacterium sp. UBA7663 TaxID=1946557 RepID=UPI0025BF6C98|nr:SIMPL domain-containing protein [Flavobacterium sp. UBA7663]
MKKLTSILFFALSYLTFAQPTENQIRVVGKHSETIKATQIELVFTLQEVTTLTYSKEKQVIKTISEVLEEVQSFISKNNYSKEKLSFQSISDKTFGNNTRNYSLSLNNIEKGIELINNLKVNGVTAVQINYVFDKSEEFAREMSSKALENAKSKAEFLASKSNKKIGKLLVIDDNTPNWGVTGGTPNYLANNNKQPEQTNTYTLYVTYELLDK